MSETEKQEIAEALDGVIQPGSSWVVRGIANDVLVEPYDVAAGNRKHSFSHGLVAKLDSVNQIVADSGGLVPLMLVMATIIVCVGLHLNWFNVWIGEKIQFVQSIWVYLPAVTTSFFISGKLSDWFEGRTYRRLRPDLIRQIKGDGLEVSEVYVKIKENEDLSYVARWMRYDEVIGQEDPMSSYGHLQ